MDSENLKSVACSSLGPTSAFLCSIYTRLKDESPHLQFSCPNGHRCQVVPSEAALQPLGGRRHCSLGAEWDPGWSRSWRPWP